VNVVNGISWLTRWGLLLVVMVTAASMQDRDGGRRLLERLRFVMPSVAHIWADGGYAGRLVAYARTVLRRSVTDRGQEAWPARVRGVGASLGGRGDVVVARALRRLVHDYERLPAHSEAMVKWTMIGLMSHRLAPTPGRRPWQTATPK
jgi:DDE family transposase